MKVKIYCILGAMLLLLPILSVPTLANQPPETPELFASVVNGYRYDFHARTTDPDGDDVFYLFDWGDGTFSEWYGPFPSNDGSFEIEHPWENEGTYTVRVKAKDVYDAESDWSEPEIVEFKKKAYIYDLHVINPFIGRNQFQISFRNIGYADATEIVVSIRYAHVERSGHGEGYHYDKQLPDITVDLVSPQESIVVTSHSIIGLGKYSISIMVRFNDGYHSPGVGGGTGVWLIGPVMIHPGGILARLM